MFTNLSKGGRCSYFTCHSMFDHKVGNKIAILCLISSVPPRIAHLHDLHILCMALSLWPNDFLKKGLNYCTQCMTFPTNLSTYIDWFLLFVLFYFWQCPSTSLCLFVTTDQIRLLDELEQYASSRVMVWSRAPRRIEINESRSVFLRVRATHF